MSNTLCIDWGNTQVKAALFNEENKIVSVKNFNGTEVIPQLQDLMNTWQPKAGVFCAVTNNTQEAEQLLNENLSKFIRLDTNTYLPIMNAYSTPETLGTDRLAIAVGAQAAFPNTNVLAISIGTCITYNFIQKNKAFRGGAISPGLRMRLRSMHEWTDKLPVVEPEGEVLLLGYDTATSMRSGAIYGMASEIDGMIAAFEAQYPDFNAVLTGGDAALFANKLKSKIFADPDLLLKGLNLILKHNVPILH